MCLSNAATTISPNLVVRRIAMVSSIVVLLRDVWYVWEERGIGEIGRERFDLRVVLWLLLDEGGRVVYEDVVKEYAFDEMGSGFGVGVVA
jgi:hypothetical protein